MIELRELAIRHWSALSLSLHLKNRPISGRYSLALFVLHLLGLLAIVRLTHQPLWLALAPVLLIQPLAVSLRLKRRYLLSESLAPLCFAYGVLALRLLIAIVARIQGLTSGSLTVPEPWGGLLNLNIATALSGLWVLLAQMGPMAEAFGRRVHWKNLLGCTLALLSLAWSVVTYMTIRTKGVTASDPYAYTQMAVDIARHGTPLHTFPLALRVAEWDLPLWPAVPVGYNLPDMRTGTAATVWPPGYSVLLAIAYWMGGETGLYVLTPLLGLATLLALWWLCLEVSHTWQNDCRFLAAGIAVFILATSYEQVDRLTVPIADIPSQLFTILTIYFALRGTRGQTFLFASLSGLCLGIAFAIRYTQVLLGLGVLFVWLLFFSQYRPRSWRVFLPAVARFGAAAWLMALPILWYHKIAFGGPFRVGSAELALFGWEHIPRTFIFIVRGFLSTDEFFYLAPFLGWGMIRLWRSSQRAAIALLVWLVVIVLFHLPYAALRIRDLLSVFPVLSLWAGTGMADSLSQIQRIGRPIRRKGMQVLGLCLIIALLYIRTCETLQLPTPATGFNTFGYLRAEQRAAFDALASLTPSEAIVAASLNSGPIGLYANRDAVRPAYWSQDEWLDFVARVLSDGRKVYLLVDGEEMHDPFQIVQSHYQLTLVSFLHMPYFYPGGSSDNLDVPLYEVVNLSVDDVWEREGLP